MIYHNNGVPLASKHYKGPYFFDVMLKNFYHRKDLYKKFSRPNNLDIITTLNLGGLPGTLKCLRYLGITDYVVLGKHIKKWQHKYKVTVVLDYLKNKGSTEYVLYLDAPDCLLDEDPHIILERFISEFECDVLFGADKVCFPRVEPQHTPKEIRMIEESISFEESHYQAPFNYLCAGTYIGRRTAIIAYLKKVSESFKLVPHVEEDQMLCRYAHMQSYPNVKIDDKRRIFTTLGPITRDDLDTPLIKDNLSDRLTYLVSVMKHACMIICKKTYWHLRQIVKKLTGI